MEKYTREELESYLLDFFEAKQEYKQTIKELEKVAAKNLSLLFEIEERVTDSEDEAELVDLFELLSEARERRARHWKRKAELESELSIIEQKQSELVDLLSQPPGQDGYYRRKKISDSEPH